MNVKRGIVSVSWDDHRELFKDLSQTRNQGQFVFVSPLRLHSIDLEVCDGFHQQLRGGGMRVRSNCSKPLHPRKTKPLSLDISLDILALAAEQDINKWHWRFFRTALFHFASSRSHHGRGRNPQETPERKGTIRRSARYLVLEFNRGLEYLLHCWRRNHGCKCLDNVLVFKEGATCNQQ